MNEQKQLMIDRSDAAALSMDLRSASEKMFALAREPGGTTCPCCRKHVQFYRRKFNVRMALSLIYLYRATRNNAESWVHISGHCVREYGFIPGDHAKTIWWGLLERKPTEDEGKKHSGFYRLTEKGRAFVERRHRIRPYAVEYMSEVEYFTGEPIYIDDALTARFDYAELMREPAYSARIRFANV